MTTAEAISTFLSVCPTINSAWAEHLKFWGDDPQRGVFNDAAVIAHHLVDSFGRGDESEFPAAFALLERCLLDGDDGVRSFAVIGVIEGIQNIASHRPFGRQVFYPFLGPMSRAAWDELCESWQRVISAKAAGLLEPPVGHAAASSVDPSQVEDPALRRILEQMHRREG
jgi:hypothetical protein